MLWLSLTRSAWPMWPPRTSLLGLCAVDISNGMGLANVAIMDIPAGIVCCGYPRWDQLGQRGHHGHPHWDCVPWLFPMGSALGNAPLSTLPRRSTRCNPLAYAPQCKSYPSSEEWATACLDDEWDSPRGFSRSSLGSPERRQF